MVEIPRDSEDENLSDSEEYIPDSQNDTLSSFSSADSEEDAPHNGEQNSSKGKNLIIKWIKVRENENDPLEHPPFISSEVEKDRENGRSMYYSDMFFFHELLDLIVEQSFY